MTDLSRHFITAFNISTKCIALLTLLNVDHDIIFECNNLLNLQQAVLKDMVDVKDFSEENLNEILDGLELDKTIERIKIMDKKNGQKLQETDR